MFILTIDGALKMVRMLVRKDKYEALHALNGCHLVDIGEMVGHSFLIEKRTAVHLLCQ